jgi:hypothetical protein
MAKIKKGILHFHQATPEMRTLGFLYTCDMVLSLTYFLLKQYGIPHPH